MKNTLKIALAGFGYLLVFILGATSGLIHPACYAYVGAILPLLSAFLYLYQPICRALAQQRHSTDFLL